MSNMTDEEFSNTSTPPIFVEDKWERLMSNLPHLESTVLCTYPIKVGRSQNCDIIIKSENIPPNFNITNISKEHFALLKDLENSVVCLTDYSKNGTWVDGTKINKGDNIALQDGSKIGFGPTTSNAFIFKKLMVDELPNTLTPVTISDSGSVATEIKLVWGRLLHCMLGLTSIDLVTDVFKIGKTAECDLNIEKTNLDKKFRNMFSREHFTIYKDAENPIAYIKDHSRFGTYLNNELIGKDKMHVLQHDDVISVGTHKYQMYVYKRMYSLGTNELPPKLQKRYEPIKFLGKGAAGEVTLAFEKGTCEMYAVKKILKGKSTFSQINRVNHPSKIECEINILKSISHPFVIFMKDFEETPNEVFLVLEYMKGGELTNRILSNVLLTEGNIKLFFFQMVLAVRFLHENGVTHRDLKPENVLLATEDVETLVKVSDFGLSKVTQDETVMNTFCGTLQYVAPELFGKRYTKQVDIWSLGVILFYMFSKQLPFRASSKKQMVTRIIFGRYEMGNNWDNVSIHGRDLVKKMLVVKPSERVTINEIVQHPWLANDAVVRHKVQHLLDNMYPSQEFIVSYDLDQPSKRLRLESEESII